MMKCICGYFHMTKEEIEEADITEQDYLWENNGERPFMRIDIEATAGMISIYRCPSCGTLRS